MMKTAKKIRLIGLAVLMFLLSCMPVLATDKASYSIYDLLADNGFDLQEGTNAYLITEDSRQYVQVVEQLCEDSFAVSILTSVSKTEDGLVSAKMIPSVDEDTIINLSAKSSVGRDFTIGNTGIVITVTGYYQAETTPNLSPVWYMPSGVMGKWSRQSGSSSVSSLNCYFSFSGDLYNQNQQVVQTDYVYTAEFTQANPAMNVLYADYESLPTGHMMTAYASFVKSRGLGFEVIIDGESYDDSIPLFNG